MGFNKYIFLVVISFLGLLGVCNGLASYTGYCDTQYLDFRKPIHYVLFPHTVGYYLGRILAHPYGEDRSYTICYNIFNHTMKGPIKRVWDRD